MMTAESVTGLIRKLKRSDGQSPEVFAPTKTSDTVLFLTPKTACPLFLAVFSLCF